MSLRPFWSYYGGKWRAAKHYPEPQYRTIFEPFAGAAGYSLRYADHQVVLIDANPRIAALWAWLISAPESEIRALPLIEPGQAIDELGVRPEAATLIGFALNPGAAAPKRRRGVDWKTTTRDYPFNYWSPAFRERTASQLTHIRHWRAFCACATDLPAMRGVTWFVDPPYAGRAGSHYPCGSDAIDYAQLGAWCRAQASASQVIACEAQGADWLPFRPLGSFKANGSKNHSGRTLEAIWP